ncbi:lipocalin family protein [Confluentibacter sediminis]|uniref:lipocalin family protein n=1 Tax=Confluentibacter sediminis TaxID=2219045 RepID=UPI000DAE6B21|nr:lipocalin family protein [Confluentibacter sediminis]
MKHLVIFILLLLSILSSCSKKDTNDEPSSSCPETNTSLPLILGEWQFTGTIINGELLIEDCDLLTTATIDKHQFKWINYGGTNCSEITHYDTCYAIEGNKVIYINEEDGNGEPFYQEIETLNETELVLKRQTNTDVVTENFKRIN